MKINPTYAVIALGMLVGCGDDGDATHPTAEKWPYKLPGDLAKFEEVDFYRRPSEERAASIIKTWKDIRLPASAEFLGGVTDTEWEELRYRLPLADASAVFEALTPDWVPLGIGDQPVEIQNGERSLHRYFGIVIGDESIYLKYDPDTQLLSYSTTYDD